MPSGRLSRYVVLLSAALAMAVGGLAACDASQAHVLPGAPVPQYLSDPPTSGSHEPGPTLSGVIAATLSKPRQVGVLEGGEVLVQYRPVEVSGSALTELGTVAGKTVVAPNPSLPSPIVATAWLAKRSCSAVDVAALRDFVSRQAGKGPGGHP